MNYAVSPAGELDQGDLIRRVTLFRKAPVAREESPDLLISHVMVLSHGCEIDKPSKPELGSDTVIVVRLVRLSAVPQGLQRDARAQRVRNLFFLPMADGMPEEAVVDWRTIQPVDKAQILEARGTDRYICTVSGDLLDAARERLWEFLFRERP